MKPVGYCEQSSLDDLKDGKCTGIMLGTFSERYSRTVPMFDRAYFECIASVHRNASGQIIIKSKDGGLFDISKYIGAKLYISTPTPNICVWKQNDEGIYATSCNHHFSFVDGNAEENQAKFCQYCGAIIAEQFEIND